MNLTGLYGITDPKLLPTERLLPAVEAALAAGLRVLQFRHKQSNDTARLEQAQALARLCRRYGVPLLINDDIELCQAVGADGVHLGQSDMPLERARAVLGAKALIGISCHQSLDLAVQAEAAGADYVAFGRFFPSQTKPDAPAADPEILLQAKTRLRVPVVAIGGINADNGASLLAAGADLLAVIHALFGTEAVGDNARRLVELFNSPDNMAAKP